MKQLTIRFFSSPKIFGENPVNNRIFTGFCRKKTSIGFSPDFNRTITTFFSHARNFFVFFLFKSEVVQRAVLGEVCAVRCSEVQRAAWSSEVHGAVQWGAVSLWGAVCLTPPVNVQCSVGMLIFCYKISIFTLRFFTSFSTETHCLQQRKFFHSQ